MAARKPSPTPPAEQRLVRCSWPGEDPLYVAYHDTEWGVPEYDSRALWEKLILDGFQAGLAWITILRKRESFRLAFDGFDPVKVAAYGPAEIERLVADPGIVRHRGKIEGAVKNARAYLAMEASDPGAFSRYVWGHFGGQPLQNGFRAMSEVPAATDISTAMSKDLKKRGFTFCGPTIVYAWLQACGVVNDHMMTCFRHGEVAAMGKRGS
jgi:DNA-3-methyladenine glycosylase I